MASAQVLFRLALAMAVAVVLAAANPESVLDFCVADTTASSPILVTGSPCKPVANVTSSDFVFALLPAKPIPRYKVGASPASSGNWPALNAQGISLLRLDLDEGGLVPPHTHTRATEVFYIIQGTVECGFFSGGALYKQTVSAGQAFLFPRGLIHYQKNVGSGPAYGLASFNSQSPGIQIISSALLTSQPPLETSVLAQDWNVKASEVSGLIKAYTSP